MAQTIKDWLLALGGIELERVSHRERMASALGGFLGIWAILLISLQFAGTTGAAIIVASMGASAVLLFAVPHGKLSQPWSLVGGHLISATIGVTCAKLIGDEPVAAAAAVGLAIGAMHYARCIHPPGGASALAAVVGGAEVHQLGYAFVVTPVMLNVAVILTVAVLVNAVFPWRLYPIGLSRLRRQAPAQEERVAKAALNVDDIRYAVEKMDLIVDVTDDDLSRIYSIAQDHAKQSHMQPDDIKLGHYYSNGEYGSDWAVRQILDEQGQGDDDQVIYCNVAGKNRRSTGVTTRGEFARWARYEVVRHESLWKQVQAEEE